jgi:cellulose synthase/poly-beta-1,6-N-acetylglucosamine synthase-like glycosyltransferase
MSFFEKKNLLGAYKPLKGDEKELPSITFLVPCWNEESTIDNTVQSLKDLSYPKDKLFIYLIDDGSKDNTWNVMKGYENDPMVKIFKKENGGKHTALNFALPHVTTDLVASFDADTTINKDALYKIVPYFIEKKDLPLMVGVLPMGYHSYVNKLLAW